MPVYLCLCLCLYQSVSVSRFLCLYMCLYQSVSGSRFLCLYMCLYQSVSVFASLSVYLFLCLLCLLCQSVSVSGLCLYLYLLCQPESVSVFEPVSEKTIATCTSTNVLEKKEEMKVEKRKSIRIVDSFLHASFMSGFRIQIFSCQHCFVILKFEF